MWIDQHKKESTWNPNNLKKLTRSMFPEDVLSTGKLVLERGPRIIFFGFGIIDLHAVICRPEAYLRLVTLIKYIQTK